jgi:hypothetical protein
VAAPAPAAVSTPEPVQTMAVPDTDVKTQELAPSPTKVADPEPAATVQPVKDETVAGKPADVQSPATDAPQSTTTPADPNATPVATPQPVSTSTTSQNEDWNILVPAVAKLANVR